jgi:hypothetical protein
MKLNGIVLFACLLVCYLVCQYRFKFHRPGKPLSRSSTELFGMFGCGVARLLACRTAVRQSQIRFLTWHPHGGLSALKKIQRDFNDLRWMYVTKYDFMLKMEKSIKIFEEKKTTKLTNLE